MGSAIAAKQEDFTNSTTQQHIGIKSESQEKTEVQASNSSEILPKNESVGWNKVRSDELKQNGTVTIAKKVEIN